MEEKGQQKMGETSDREYVRVKRQRNGCMLENGVLFAYLTYLLKKVLLSKFAQVLQLIFAGKFVPKFYLISAFKRKSRKMTQNIHFLSPVCSKGNL